MKTSSLTSLITLTICTLVLDSAYAKKAGEKCQIIGYNESGEEVGLIKEGMADCQSDNSTCSGTNPSGEKEAWLYLPKGVCEKIEGGKVVK